VRVGHHNASAILRRAKWPLRFDERTAVPETLAQQVRSRCNRTRTSSRVRAWPPGARPDVYPTTMNHYGELQTHGMSD